MPAAATVHRVRATNPATQSENRIHADDVARQYGFRGGLVPGVTLWAYLTNPVVQALGPAFLERGWMRATFRHPVYEGDDIECAAEPEQAPTLAADAVLGRHDHLALSVYDSSGTRGVEGEAALIDPAGASGVHVVIPERPAPGERPPADERTLAPDTVLGSLRATFRAERAPEFLDVIAEPLSLYRDERVAHPGWLIRFANDVLVANVKLGPWIHVQSDVVHLGVVRDGDVVVTRAQVVDNFERSGHRFVDLHVQLTVAGTPVMDVNHRAIDALRPPADSST